MTTSTAHPTRSRLTHEERSAAMQQRLLDATVASLAESGYGATTTLAVQQRAGVSRGALLHHFPSRSDLILAAVEHVAKEWISSWKDLSLDPPASNRIGWAVRSLWSCFVDPLFLAIIELSLAARRDPEVKSALVARERRLDKVLRGIAAEMFGPAASAALFPSALEVLLDSMRGAASSTVARSQKGQERLLADWTLMMETLLSSSPANRPAR